RFGCSGAHSGKRAAYLRVAVLSYRKHRLLHVESVLPPEAGRGGQAGHVGPAGRSAEGRRESPLGTGRIEAVGSAYKSGFIHKLVAATGLEWVGGRGSLGGRSEPRSWFQEKVGG